MAVRFQRGTIVYAKGVPDPQGKNHKDRKVVLVADFHDSDAFARVVAITTEFTLPLRPDAVALPFQRRGGTACTTSLTEESVAVCGWAIKIVSADIDRRTGAVSTKDLTEILNRIDPSFFLP
jgi:hypothetical protein